MNHCDFFGRELFIGDRVVFILRDYCEFRHGEIVGLNNKRATIRDLDYDGPLADRMGHGMTVRDYCRIIKEM